MFDNLHLHPNIIVAQAKFYSNMISVYIPKTPIARQRTEVKDKTKCRNSNIQRETSEERSLRRTRKAISNYVLCNQFTLFVTFTFAQDRDNIDEKRHQLSNWFKNQQKRNQKFQYLAIPEFHQDGKSLHFHALFRGYTGKLIPATNPKTKRQIKQHGKQIYSLAEYRLGFTNVKVIDNSSSSQGKVAQYIVKYITKETPVFKNKKRYFCSQGLLKPKVVNNPSGWFEKITPDWTLETELGTFLRFNAGSHPAVDRLLRWHNEH